MTEICTFSTFTHVCQACFAYNLFVHFFETISTDLISAGNSAFFDTFFDLKKILGQISAFSNFEAKRAKNGAKNKKKRIK